MKKTRGFKHYLRFWLIATGLYAIYIIYLSFDAAAFDPSVLFSIGILPLAFTFLLFVFDQIFDKIWPSKEKKKDDEFSDFLKKTTYKVNEKLKLGI